MKKKLLSLLLVVMMVMTTIPATAFAAEAGQGAGAGAEQVATATPSEYLKANYVDGSSKIIRNGGTGVVKSADGLSYEVGLESKGSYGSSSINSLNFVMEKSSSEYQSAWFFSDEGGKVTEYLAEESILPGDRTSVSIKKRPTTKEGAYQFTATLKLYAKEATKETITSGAAHALAEQAFTIKLMPQAKVRLQAVNSVTNEVVKGATIELKKDSSSWSRAESPESDGSYLLDPKKTYYVFAKADGYKEKNAAEMVFAEDGTYDIELEQKVIHKVKFEFTGSDTAGKPIANVDVKVEAKQGYSYNEVTAESDGSYKLEQGETYYLTTFGNADYRNLDRREFSPIAAGKHSIELTKIEKVRIEFKVMHEGKIVKDAKITVKQDKKIVEMEADGSFKLEKNIPAEYTVKARNFAELKGTMTPTVAMKKPLELVKDITEYSVIFKAVTDKGTAIENAAIEVSYEEEDPWGWGDPTVYPVTPGEDGFFALNRDITYDYTVKATGYRTFTGKFTPGGADENITHNVVLKKDEPVNPENKKIVDAVKAKYDSEFGALRPNFATDKNIADFVLNKIKAYEGIDTTNVKVRLLNTEDVNYIGVDGAIFYKKDAEAGNATKNISTQFVFECGNEEAVSKSRTVTVGWDRDHFGKKMAAEAKGLTEDQIKGTNSDLTSVRDDLTLPQLMGTSLQTVWSKINWESSNPAVLSIERADNLSTTPLTGKLHPAAEDTKVRITATFVANDIILNSNIEKPEDFTTVTKTFDVVVKGSGIAKPTPEELQQLLDKYYTADKLKYSVGDGAVDTSAVTGDINLLRYTKIKDEKGQFVFNNKEITVTSSDPTVVSISGYRANVDVFQTEDKQVTLTVTFKRDNVTATKEIPLTVKAITAADLDEAVKMMEYAKAHYFDGINDGRYKDAANVTGNLHPFMEFYFDKSGNPVWVYEYSKLTDSGIGADDYFEDTWIMEANGYNKFKSSNPQVIRHDNLVVTRAQTPQQVTISTLLSSKEYGKYYEAHKDDSKLDPQIKAKLKSLYKQEVSATVVVVGTGAAKDSLQLKIKEANELLAKIVEGTKPGEYPAGTKQKLEKAIADAQLVLDDSKSDDSKLNSASVELQNSINECKNSQIADTRPKSVTVSVEGVGKFKNSTAEVSGVQMGTTVWTVMEKYLADNGYRVEKTEKFGSVYVNAITDPNNVRLSDKDSADSGWLYTVDGVLPSVYMSGYPLKGGENIKLYYTGNWKEDPNAGGWPEEEQKPVSKDITASVSGSTASARVPAADIDQLISDALKNKADIIDLNIKGADKAEKISVELPKASVQNIADKTDAALNINTALGNVTLDRRAMTEAVKAAAGDEIPHWAM